MAEPIDIEIFGKTYQVRGQKDPEYTQRLAAYVDEQMRAVAERTPPSASPLQIAVLTLLHVANELFEAGEGKHFSEEALRERAEAMLGILETSLGS